MKTHIGLFIMVVLLVAACGCTSQQATPSETATISETTVSVTQVPTTVTSPLPTTFPATVSTTATPPLTSSVTTVATPKPSITPSTKVTSIHIRNNTFVPDQLTVLPGTGITWINDDPVIHIVKATGDAKGKFTSADLITGGQFRYTFGETSGTYEFMDPSYPDMKGAIIVKKGETLWVATFAPSVTPA